MPSNLTHCLVSVVVCGIVNIFIGLPPISTNIFLAGLFSMLINLDYSIKTKQKRTPWGHSIYSIGIWSFFFILVILPFLFLGVISWYSIFEILIGFIVAYITHTALDFFTIEGIYIWKKGAWKIINSEIIGITPKDDGNALLNLYLAIPSAVAVMVLVGLAA